MFGIESLEGPQERTLRQIDSAWETELCPCEIIERRYGPAEGMQAGWDERIWWIRNVSPLVDQLDLDVDDEWELSCYCNRLIREAKKTNDRSVVEKIRQALRQYEISQQLTLSDFETFLSELSL